MPALSIKEFITKSIESNPLIIDVRSESEYAHARFPGAVNIPLLNDEHRKLVGTCFKKEGRESAVRLGFKLVGPLFSDFIKQVDELSQGRKIILYCWRGGMRSGIMSWILGMAGYQTDVMKGGYKAFRRFALDQFSVPYKLGVIGGHTGCGKTELILQLESEGHQIIDLEGLANHKGSAFGALGMKAQPSTEHFENLLALKLFSMKTDRTIWVEAESRSIGGVKIPDDFFFQFISAPLFELQFPIEERIQRIKKEYGHFSDELLSACMEKIKKRLGGNRLKDALTALKEKRTEDWIAILLEYYDKTYNHSLENRLTSSRYIIDTNEMKDRNEIIGKLIGISQNVIV